MYKIFPKYAPLVLNRIFLEIISLGSREGGG